MSLALSSFETHTSNMGLTETHIHEMGGLMNIPICSLSPFKGITRCLKLIL